MKEAAQKIEAILDGISQLDFMERYERQVKLANMTEGERIESLPEMKVAHDVLGRRLEEEKGLRKLAERSRTALAEAGETVFEDKDGSLSHWEREARLVVGRAKLTKAKQVFDALRNPKRQEGRDVMGEISQAQKDVESQRSEFRSARSAFARSMKEFEQLTGGSSFGTEGSNIGPVVWRRDAERNVKEWIDKADLGVEKRGELKELIEIRSRAKATDEERMKDFRVNVQGAKYDSSGHTKHDGTVERVVRLGAAEKEQEAWDRKIRKLEIERLELVCESDCLQKANGYFDRIMSGEKLEQVTSMWSEEERQKAHEYFRACQERLKEAEMSCDRRAESMASRIESAKLEQAKLSMACGMPKISEEAKRFVGVERAAAERTWGVRQGRWQEVCQDVVSNAGRDKLLGLIDANLDEIERSKKQMIEMKVAVLQRDAARKDVKRNRDAFLVGDSDVRDIQEATRRHARATKMFNEGYARAAQEWRPHLAAEALGPRMERSSDDLDVDITVDLGNETVSERKSVSVQKDGPKNTVSDTFVVTKDMVEESQAVSQAATLAKEEAQEIVEGTKGGAKRSHAGLAAVPDVPMDQRDTVPQKMSFGKDFDM